MKSSQTARAKTSAYQVFQARFDYRAPSRINQTYLILLQIDPSHRLAHLS